MSYLLLHRWFVACLIVLALIVAAMEIRQGLRRRLNRRLIRFMAEHLARVGVTPRSPWLEEFEKRNYPLTGSDQRSYDPRGDD